MLLKITFLLQISSGYCQWTVVERIKSEPFTHGCIFVHSVKWDSTISQQTHHAHHPL